MVHISMVIIRDWNQFWNPIFCRVPGTGSGRTPKFEKRVPEPVLWNPRFVKWVPEPVLWNPKFLK
jgi:hypothetical protein